MCVCQCVQCNDTCTGTTSKAELEIKAEALPQAVALPVLASESFHYYY